MQKRSGHSGVKVQPEGNTGGCRQIAQSVAGTDDIAVVEGVAGQGLEVGEGDGLDTAVWQGQEDGAIGRWGFRVRVVGMGV
jgi:hypothetical protein